MESISTEIIFTGNEITAIEIYLYGFKFVLSNIDEGMPLNHYLSSKKLKGYVR